MQQKAKQLVSRFKLFNINSHKASFVIGLFVVFAILSSLIYLYQTPQKAQAAAGINEQLNYQARLLDSTGAVVADGTYNMEFKIYQDGTGCVSGGTPPCSGTLKWTETRTSTNKVTVKNGYFSVNLGSVTAFGTSVDWNQDTLWLSINIGGTGTPTWDGEMTPFRRLAAVPYAMNAKQLGGLDASKFVQLAPSAVQVDSGTLSSIYINKTGATGNILQLQNNGVDKFTIGNTGAVTLNYTSTSATAGTESGQTVAVTDTGAVTTGTDNTYGININATRTGASGSAIVNTFGVYSLAVGDTGGTSTAIGLAGLGVGADTTYGVAGAGLNGGAGQTEVDGVSGTIGTFFFTGTTTSTNAFTGLINLDSAGTYTTASGLLIKSATLSGGGTITTNNGIWVQTQTVGTTNVGLRVDTAAGAGTNQTVWIAGNDASATTAAKGIAFGSAKDATLYRGGANILQTDGAFLTSGRVAVNSTGSAGTNEVFRVNTPNTVDNATMAIITNTGANTNKVLTLQGVAGQFAQYLSIQTSGGTILGGIDLYGNYRAPAGSSTIPGLSFQAEGTLGLYRPSSGVLAITANADIAQFSSTGQILTGDLTFSTGANRTISVATSTTGAGNSLAITGSAGLANANNNGGAISITGGLGSVSNGIGQGGAGGAVSITGGSTNVSDWQGNAGGAVTVSGGTPNASVAAVNSPGGVLTLNGGTGGAATGFASSGGGTGGAVAINSGGGGAAAGGGNQSGGNAAGITLTAGNGGTSIGSAANSNGGGITLQAGSAGTGGGGAAGTPGNINFQVATGATINIGANGIANTIQIGNTSGAVSQTLNIGNNSTASSTNNVNIGSSIAGTTAITGTTTITGRASGSSDVLTVGTGLLGNKGLIVKGVASQSGNLQEWQNSGGTMLAQVGADGKISIKNSALGSESLDVYGTGTSSVAAFQSNGQTNGSVLVGYTVGNAVTGTVYGYKVQGSTTGALQATVQQNGAGSAISELLVLGAGDAYTLYDINGGQAWSVGLDNSDSDSFKISSAGVPGTNDYLRISVTGQTTFQNSTDSNTAFVIKDLAGAALFTTDTTARGAGGGNLVKIGNSTGTDTATTILQVDSATANPTSNLSALNGGIFYNSTSNKMSIIENGAVKVLCNTTDAGCGSGGATTLQSAYAATSGNTIVATDGRDLSFTFPDTTTDPNFTINLQCVTSCGSNGRFAVQSAGTDVFTIAPSGTILATKHSSFGGGAAIDSCPDLSPCEAVTGAQETFTNLSSTNKVGNYTHITLDPSANSIASSAGGIFITETKAGNTKDLSGYFPVIGSFSGGIINGDGNVSVAAGSLAQVQNNGSGTLSNAIGYFSNLSGNGAITYSAAFASNIAYGSGAVTDSYGLAINTVSGSAITNNYGISVSPQTAATNNYGIVIGTASTQTLWIGNDADGTTANAGIVFGSSQDTNLYRDAASSLKTDDKFTAAGLVTTAANTVQFNDSDNSNFVAFKSASTVTSNVTWTLPSADSAGCFQSDGSGTISIAACGDTNVQTFSSNGDYTVPTNALMVLVEAWGGGGGGGGGAGGTTAASRSGGAGGGGGGYNSTIITASSLGTAGTVVKVSVGSGGTAGNGGSSSVGTDGGAGGATCFSTTTSCAGSIYFRVYGGGGGNGDGTAGSGGGGGGGASSAGTTNATAATGGAGGSPLGAAAGAQNSGFGGAGGATAAATGAAGGSAGYGGGGGGSSSSTGAGNSGAGGGSSQGGAGGGGGGSCAITTCTQRSGGAGGSVPNLSGGGGTAGVGAGVSGGAGNAGVGSGGDGGGGGANAPAGAGGAGGAGGARGGGGGGGGAGITTTGGAGGAGGAGYLRAWTLRGAGADLAEMYNTYDNDMIAGDVVAIDSSLQSGVKKTSNGYDPNTIGVISTKPGLILGDETNGQGAKTVMVALAGRVPVKVSLENGPIKVGDPLTPSSTPGVAMKATKYGPIIGQAMTAYTGDGPGYVVVFIKNSHANGSKLSDALQSASTKYQDPQKTLAQNALAYFSEEGKVKADSSNASEIYTDRVTAAIEVISPHVATNSLSTDSITSTTGSDVKLNLTTDGKFSINNVAGEQVASIDDKGNANFKGTITADKIKANQIEGLEILTNQISSLAEAQKATEVATSGATSTSPSTQTYPVALKDITAQTAIVSGDLTANGTLFANGALKVAGPAEFLGDSIFYKLATFIDKTIFKGSVQFDAPATFGDKIIVNNNTAGTVKIPVGETKIVIQFSKPYATPPVINATPIGIIAPKYGVTNITKDGFEIDIDPAQPTETQFNWFAVETEQ